jgi:ribosomal protein S18 acetylase RimI-like enzyme
MVEILKLSTVPPTQFEKVILEIRDIFFLSTSIKEFSSEERKEAFFKRWCGDFINLFPGSFYLMKEEGKLLGYLSGCLDSQAATPILEVPGYLIFEDQFAAFPAHLHINFHPDCRGRGLGSNLVVAFIEDLKKQKSKGVHLVTSPDAKNISFYQRLGFTHEIQRRFATAKGSSALLFMGKVLD